MPIWAAVEQKAHQPLRLFMEECVAAPTAELQPEQQQLYPIIDNKGSVSHWLYSYSSKSWICNVVPSTGVFQKVSRAIRCSFLDTIHLHLSFPCSRSCLVSERWDWRKTPPLLMEIDLETDFGFRCISTVNLSRGIRKSLTKARRLVNIQSRMAGKCCLFYFYLFLKHQYRFSWCLVPRWELLDDPSQNELCSCCDNSCRARPRRGTEWGTKKNKLIWVDPPLDNFCFF